MYPISFQIMYWQLNVLCLYILTFICIQFFFLLFPWCWMIIWLFLSDALISTCIRTYLHSLNNLHRGKSVKIKATNRNVAQIDSLHCKYLSSLCIRLYALMITMYRRINSIFIVYFLCSTSIFLLLCIALENRILY